LSVAEALDPTPGFIGTLFPSAAMTLAQRSVAQVDAVPTSTAVVLSANEFDRASLSRAADPTAGKRMSPLMFHQTVATSTTGAITIRFGLTGASVCVAAPPGLDGFDVATQVGMDMIGAGDAEAVLVVCVTTDLQGRMHGMSEVLRRDGL
jgi:3-oxoacyl-(acyl-carrier-protein) synthase